MISDKDFTMMTDTANLDMLRRRIACTVSELHFPGCDIVVDTIELSKSSVIVISILPTGTKYLLSTNGGYVFCVQEYLGPDHITLTSSVGKFPHQQVQVYDGPLSGINQVITDIVNATKL